MASIVIAEKPDQAGRYREAVGTRYGDILAARGHLFELMPPEKLKPEWVKWSIGLLRDGDNFYPQILNVGRDKQDAADMARRYNAIRDKAKTADTIYIATDPDREGEGIGGNIVAALRRDINWKGRTFRVLRVSDNPQAIAEAFANAEPGEKFEPLYQSYLARANADHIFNLSLTRSASDALKAEGERAVVSIGRVLTPTLGIACRRELAIKNHIPRDYWHPWVLVEGQAGQTRLTYNPGEAGRLFNIEDAKKIADLVGAYSGAINVRKERKQQKPPALFSLAKLQVEASRRLKWPVEKTTDVMQSLYETHKIATYPRSMEVSLPESEIDNAPAMFKGVLSLPFMSKVSYESQGPAIRREKGAFSDKDLKGAAHYAIVPDIRTIQEWPAIFQRMSADERSLFEIIARRYLASISPMRVYDATKQYIQVAEREFSVTGTVEVEAGWKEALGQANTKEDSDEGQDQDDAGLLPAFRNGDPVKARETGVQKLTTKPPSRFTDASLVIQMIEAWREVSDPALRDVLKEAGGIGTEATRSHIVKNLIARNFVKVEKGQLVVTDAGMGLFETLMRFAPKLLDVGLTAEMEVKLDRIKSSETDAGAVVHEICRIAESAIQGFIDAKSKGVVVQGLKGGGSRKPTPAMINAAKSKAARNNEKLPAGVTTDFQKCRNYLGELPPRSSDSMAGSRVPSEAQLRFAQKIAGEKGLSIPEATLKDARLISEWISKNKGGNAGSPTGEQTGQRPPSEAQLRFARKIAAEKSLTIPAGVLNSGRAISDWITKNKAAKA